MDEGTDTNRNFGHGCVAANELDVRWLRLLYNTYRYILYNCHHSIIQLLRLLRRETIQYCFWEPRLIVRRSLGRSFFCPFSVQPLRLLWLSST